MIVTVNSGFGYPIGCHTFRWLCDFGVQGIRQDIPWGASDGYLEQLLGEIVDAEMTAVPIIAGWMVWYDDGIAPGFRGGENPPVEAVAYEAARVAKIAKRIGLRCFPEIGNEPTLTASYKHDPNRYAKAVRAASEAIWEVDPDVRVAAGSIHDLTPDSRRYLEEVVLKYGIPERTVLAIHPYRPGNPPWETFTTLGWPYSGPPGGKVGIEDVVVQWLRAIWPGDIAVSEMGWHTAPRRERAGLFGLCPRHVSWTDDEVAQFWRWELDFWRKAGAVFCNVFQLNDGSDGRNHEHRFGIRDLDGNPKPAAWAIKEFSEAA